MKSLAALSTVPENAAGARDLRWFWMPARMPAMPYDTSIGERAYTNWPRELTVACHRSSTPAAPLFATGKVGEFGLLRSGQNCVPAVMAASVALRLDASSTPSEPNEIAEKL